MIVSNLQGGLGNQMFQYALGKVLALNYNTELFLNSDGLYIPVEGHLSRDYMLNPFNIECKIANEKILCRIKYGNWRYKFNIKKLKHYKQLVHDEIDPKKTSYKHAKYFCKPDLKKFYPELLKNDDADIILDGYWQSYKYLTGYEDMIKKHFQIKKEYLTFDSQYLKKIQNTTSVSLHLRRTDRVETEFSLSFFRFLEWEYYEKAISIIKEKVHNPHFFIFSDSIDWCKNNVRLDAPTTFVETKDEYNDMYLMGQCKHHIIAHSTFSWWAVWLNYNTSKIVISPVKWFNNQDDNLEDLLLDNWIKL